jgi:hypothetical protein
VLRLAVRRQPAGVGGQEGERRLLVLAVLGQVEVHPADHVPGRVELLEELGHRGLRLGALALECLLEIAPQRGQHLTRQVLRPRHDRRRGGQRLQLRVGRRRHLGSPAVHIGNRAQAGDVARAELAPVRERGRQGLSNLAGAQPEEAVPGAAGERLLEPARQRRIHHCCLARASEDQPAMRRETGDEALLVAQDTSHTLPGGPEHVAAATRMPAPWLIIRRRGAPVPRWLRPAAGSPIEWVVVARE